MNRATNIFLITFLAGLSLLVPAAIGLFGAGVPTLICPLPALTVIPAFYLSSYLRSGLVFRLAVVLHVLLFFAWNPGLL